MPHLGRPRTPRPPALDRSSLSTGEKALASAQLEDGRWLVATSHALLLLSARPGESDGELHAPPSDAEIAPAAEALAWRREWTDVDRAALDAESRTLTIRWATGLGEEHFELAENARRAFTRTVNERITASVVAAREIKVPGGRARVAVRRAADGDLFSQVIALGAIDIDDPETARKLDEAEDEVRESAGLD